MSEAVLFLRGPVNGEVKGPQTLTLLWNHTPKAVINEPEYKKLFSKWTNLRGRMEQASTRRAPPAEVDLLKKECDGLEKDLNAWTGVAHIYNPEMDLDKLPRLLIESIEVSGPIQKECFLKRPPSLTLRVTVLWPRIVRTPPGITTLCELVSARCPNHNAAPFWGGHDHADRIRE